MRIFLGSLYFIFGSCLLAHVLFVYFNWVNLGHMVGGRAFAGF